MKLRDKISWLMGRVQRSLFPHLNQCLVTPLTEQEERLVSILEIVRVERYVSRTITRFRYPGRKLLDRQALARAFVAKACYRYATTLLQTISRPSQHFRELSANLPLIVLAAKSTMHW